MFDFPRGNALDLYNGRENNYAKDSNMNGENRWVYSMFMKESLLELYMRCEC